MTDAPPRRLLWFVHFAMVIDAMGIGLIAPVAPQLIMDLTGSTVADAAATGGWLAVSYTVMQFLLSPVLGNLSDRFGRRPILFGSLAALLVDYVVMGLAPTITWLFVGRLISGAAGATYATAGAVVADVTPPEERAKQFGMLGAAWGIGFILGPVLGGLIGSFGPRVPFFVAAALVAINLAVGLLVFRETLPPENRRPFTLARSHLLASLRVLRRYPVVFVLLGAIVLYRIAHDALPTTWTFFVMQQFNWGPRGIGVSLALIGLATAIVQGGLVGPISKRIGEANSVRLGFGAGMLSMVGYAFAWNGAALAVCIAIGAFFGLAMPSMQSIMSREVPANEQGELQGAIAGISSLTAIVTPLAMTQIFRAFSGATPPFGLELPGAPFLAAAVALAGALAIFSFSGARTDR